jgi:hypothetical protein
MDCPPKNAVYFEEIDNPKIKKKRNLDTEWADVRTVRAANNGSRPMRDSRQGGKLLLIIP